MKKYSLFIALFLAAQIALAQHTWRIDVSHSKVGFAVSHMVVSEVEGRFKQFSGSVESSSKDFEDAKVSFTAQTTSISTDNAKRDGHLRSDAFFDVKQFPTISFAGVLHKKEGNKYTLKGKLTMKGISKDVSFDVVYKGSIDTGNGIKAGFKLMGMIDRQDYGLKWRKALASGEYAVGDEVKISCLLELDKQS